jgi:hypothetical protein
MDETKLIDSPDLSGYTYPSVLKNTYFYGGAL